MSNNSINNKIKKPFINVGFDKKGHIKFNIDMNKVKGLNEKNLNDAFSSINSIATILNNGKPAGVIKPKKEKFTRYDGNQITEVVRKFCNEKEIQIQKTITSDHLIKIDDLCRKNMKLAALKLFKEASGNGLKDSNDFINWYIKNSNINYKYRK